MRTDKAEKFDNPIRILSFNRFKRLNAVFASYNECERITGIPHAMLQRAAKGQYVASKGYYFRELKEDVAIEDSDLGILTLFQYDRDVLHEDRRVYRKGNMQPPAVKESKLHPSNK